MEENTILEEIIRSEYAVVQDTKKHLSDTQKLTHTLQSSLTNLTNMVNEIDDLNAPLFNFLEKIQIIQPRYPNSLVPFDNISKVFSHTKKMMDDPTYYEKEILPSQNLEKKHKKSKKKDSKREVEEEKVELKVPRTLPKKEAGEL